MAQSHNKNISLTQNLNPIIDASKDEYVMKVRNVLKRYKIFSESQKNTHIWSFTPTHALKEKFEKTRDRSRSRDIPAYLKINTVSLDDLEEDVKALQQIFIYRINALLETCVSLLNKNDYLSSAIISRSLVELCAVGMHHSALVRSNYKQLYQDLPTNGLSEMVVDLPYVREIMEAGIWGTRLPKVLNRGGIKQFHIIDMMKKVAEKDDYLESLYEFLCEATHPNAIGNFLFVRTPDNADFMATTLMSISKKQNGDASAQLVEKTLGAISWSSIAAMGIDEQFQDAFLFKKKIFSNFHKKLH